MAKCQVDVKRVERNKLPPNTFPDVCRKEARYITKLDRDTKFDKVYYKESGIVPVRKRVVPYTGIGKPMCKTHAEQTADRFNKGQLKYERAIVNQIRAKGR